VGAADTVAWATARAGLLAMPNAAQRTQSALWPVSGDKETSKRASDQASAVLVLP
jgi:hypothetical protein